MSRVLKSFIFDIFTRLMEWRLTIGEIRKFKDKRRVEIYSKKTLAEEQKKAIDSFYKKNYGKRIPYIWHRHYYAMSGCFDEKYVPELLYIPEFESYMNAYSSYNSVFADKNVLPLIAKAIGVKMPRTIVSATKGMYRDSEYRMLSKKQVFDILDNVGEVFIKPTIDSDSGRGCFVANIVNGVDVSSGKSIRDIVKNLGKDFIIQERVVCSDSIATIYPNSVNTFRVMTYRWKDKIITCPIIMRIGQGGKYLDNAHAGGMYIAVDDNGTLHDVAYTEFNMQYRLHPDTKVKFAGYKIISFPSVLAAAKQMHEAMPQVGIVSWDFTIDQENNPVLIESNTRYGSIWMIEEAHGKGIFGENTEDVLRWMHLMRQLKPSDRAVYAFGQYTTDEEI